MRYAWRCCAVLMAVTLLAASPAAGQTLGLCKLFGLGCGSGSSCGDCCEPTCGCASGCGMDGRQFAGQVWDGGGCNGCVRPNDCCSSCLFGSSGCDRTCGCGPDCGPSCGPACGTSCCEEPSCGCPSGRNCDRGCCLTQGLGGLLFGCQGCSGELYWCEWVNDPPRSCEPCDRYGNWIGPSAGYRAPYDHAYGIDHSGQYGLNGQMSSHYAGGGAPQPQARRQSSPQRPAAAPTYAGRSPQPPAGLPTAKRSIATQTRPPATPTRTARQSSPTANQLLRR
jgi:hypothetical protein